MATGVGIKLTGVTFSNPNLPKLIDYKDLIANSPLCFGAWRFDRDDLVEESGSGVSRLLSWKDGGPDLEFFAGVNGQATRISDAALGHKVGRLTANCQYGLASGVTWNPTQAYTIVAVAKVSNYATVARIAGYRASATDRAYVETYTNTAPAPAVRHTRGGAIVGAPVLDAAGYFVAYGSHAGSSDLQQSVQILGGPTFKYSQAVATDTLTNANTFRIGSSISTSDVVIDIDFVALFSADLIYQEAELKGHVDDYLRMRMGIAV